MSGGRPPVQLLRLSVLYKGSSRPRTACETVLAISRGDLTELWLRCGDEISLLSTLEAIASSGVLLAVGGLDGRVFRPLPRSLEELVGSSTRELVLEPGTRAVVLAYTDVRRAVEALSQHSARITLRPRSRRLAVALSRPLGVGHLFDNRMRLLRPAAVPPILARGLASGGAGR